jgi:FkbM family methyltransferase
MAHTFSGRNDSHDSRVFADVTLFALPRVFRGGTAMLQKNAVKSWMLLQPRPQIILFGDDDGVAETANEFGLRHIPDIKRNEYGTPLINDVFEKAQLAAPNDILVHISSDIILMSDFMPAVQRVATHFNEFLMIGRRWDLDVVAEINFDAEDWQRQLCERIRKEGVLHAPTAIDYFVFRKGLWPHIPPFAIGRTALDNWLVYTAAERHPVIDATPVVTIIHQNHNYSHISADRNTTQFKVEQQRNRCLAPQAEQRGFTSDATWELTPAGLLEKPPCRPPVGCDEGLWLYQSGVEKWQKGDVAEALMLLDNARRKNPRIPGLQSIRAACLVKLKRLDEAAEAARAELSLQPNDPAALRMLELVLRMRNSLGKPQHSSFRPPATLKSNASADTCSNTAANSENHSAEIIEVTGRNSHKPINEKTSLKFMQIDTFYQRYTAGLYARKTNLAQKLYQQQLDEIFKDGFAAVHTLAPYMPQLGYDAQWVVANCAPLQLQWARENGISKFDKTSWIFDIVKAQIETFRPDIIYTTDCTVFDGKFFSQLSRKPALLLGWQAADIPAHVDWSGFDAILSPLTSLREKAVQLGSKSAKYFLPGFPSWIFDEIKQINPAYDVGFAGLWTTSQHPKRNHYLTKIAEASKQHPQYSCRFHLSGEVDKIPPIVTEYNCGEIYGLEMHKALRLCRIGFDARGSIRYFKEGEVTDIAKEETANMRIFETTGCGIFLLTEYFENLENYFEIGKEIETFKDEKELVEKIRFYLAHPELRTAIAERGRQRCLRDHSALERIKSLDNIIKELLSKQSDLTESIKPVQINLSAAAPDNGIASYKTNTSLQVIQCGDDLANIKHLAYKHRFGNFQVKFKGLTVYCNDLLSFYIAAKDIFLHRIYDFESETDAPFVIDGGGHIGLFTLFIKQKYPHAKVIIFEPDKGSLELLRKNLKANSVGNVEIVEAGLYKNTGEISFASDCSDGSSIFGDKKNSYIRVVRLSDYIDRDVDFLKLNIEGAELDVITEIVPKLQFVKQMVLEYHGFPEIGQNLHRILALLENAGFRYMLHDFDAETNSSSKPPFRLDKSTRFFLLVYARKLFSPVKADVPNPEPSAAGSPVQPVSRLFGFDRGTPIDRYYIEKFLDSNRAFIRGRVLEIGDNAYTRKYGTNVTCSDVLNFTPSAGATIVGDLATDRNIPHESFDCIILTQTIQMIYDIKSALRNAVNALKPGGTLLITASGISQISRYDMDRWGEYWRFTDKSLKTLLAEIVPVEGICVEARGNVAVAKAFLDGRAIHELSQQVLDHQDNDYQVVLTARVQKAAVPASVEPVGDKTIKTHTSFSTPLVLLYHRVADNLVDSQLLAVSPKNFEAHLRELAANYRVIPLSRLIGEIRQNKLEPDTVAITFDDGYADNLTNALPLLEKYNLPASIFVTSGVIGSDMEFWWDTMERIFLTNHSLPDILKMNDSQQVLTWNLDTPQNRLKACDQLCGILRDKPAEEINWIIEQLLTWACLPAAVSPDYLTLNTEQLIKLASSPLIEIGSHTVTHTKLSILSSQEQHNEISQSKQQLESVIGKPVRFLSYPFGNVADFTRETAAMLAQAGYEAGIANIQGNISAPTDLYAVPRRLVRNWTVNVFAAWLRYEDKNSLEKETVSARAGRLTSYRKKPLKRLQEYLLGRGVTK